MINIFDIFYNDDVAKSVSLWLGDGGDSVDLVGAIEYAVGAHVPMVSVGAGDVKTVWPWLENSNIKIMPRFYVNVFSENAISGMVVNVNSVLKQGANGALLIVKLSDLDRFSELLYGVRNDLFFNKDLSIGLDIDDVWPLDLTGMFANLDKLQATSVCFALKHDDMEHSDFVGRVYGLLTAWPDEINTELHFMLGNNYKRAEQVYRLVSAIRPKLLAGLSFFVNY